MRYAHVFLPSPNVAPARSALSLGFAGEVLQEELRYRGVGQRGSPAPSARAPASRGRWSSRRRSGARPCGSARPGPLARSRSCPGRFASPRPRRARARPGGCARSLPARPRGCPGRAARGCGAPTPSSARAGRRDPRPPRAAASDSTSTWTVTVGSKAGGRSGAGCRHRQAARVPPRCERSLSRRRARSGSTRSRIPSWRAPATPSSGSTLPASAAPTSTSTTAESRSSPASPSGTSTWARSWRWATTSPASSVGDRVLGTYGTACGECFFCLRERLPQVRQRPGLRPRQAPRRTAGRSGRASARAHRRHHPAQGAGRDVGRRRAVRGRRDGHWLPRRRRNGRWARATPSRCSAWARWASARSRRRRPRAPAT